MVSKKRNPVAKNLGLNKPKVIPCKKRPSKKQLRQKPLTH
jgi:hypothetical protein